MLILAVLFFTALGWVSYRSAGQQPRLYGKDRTNQLLEELNRHAAEIEELLREQNDALYAEEEE